MRTKEFNPDAHIANALDSYRPDFKPFFETRLMSKIAQLSEDTYGHLFNRAFQRVILSGVAAVAILLVAIFITDGSFSSDALVGTSNLDFESITAITISSL